MRRCRDNRDTHISDAVTLAAEYMEFSVSQLVGRDPKEGRGVCGQLLLIKGHLRLC